MRFRFRPAAAAVGLLAAGVALTPVSAQVEGAKPLPQDLALVPGSAVAFAHVRLADVWKTPAMTDMRATFAKAGPKALAALDSQFRPAPSTIDRMTAVVFLGDPAKHPATNGIVPVGIAQFSAPFDAADVRKAHFQNAVVRSAGGKEYFFSEADGLAVAFVGDRTMVIGDDDGVGMVLKAAGQPTTGPMAAAVKAAGAAHFFAAVNAKAIPLPPQLLEQMPKELHPILAADAITVSLTFQDTTAAEIKLVYPTEAAATDAEKGIRKAGDMGRVFLNAQRQMLEKEIYEAPKAGRPVEDLFKVTAATAGLGALNQMDELLAEPPLKRAGTDIALSAKLPAWTTQYVGLSAVSLGLALPAVQKVREAAARSQSQNNMKQIALALHNYESAYGYFPPAAIVDKKGKKLLSWRVAILPFIEQDNLYKQFKLDEPWDSAHNKPLSQAAVKVYTDPRVPTKMPNETHYKMFVGNGAMFDVVTNTKIASITDGTSNTIMTVAGGDPVPWAKPDDIDFDPKKDYTDLAKPFGGQLLMGMGDGSVRTFNARRPDAGKILNMLITRAGGEVIPEF